MVSEICPPLDSRCASNLRFFSPLEKGGRGIFLLALLLGILCSALPTQAAPTSTDHFILALTDELEAKVIGDDELVVLIDFADAGKVTNPICAATSELSAARLLAYEVFKSYIDANDLDAATVAVWARENFVASERGRVRREESRKETKLPWKVEQTLLSVGDNHVCAIDEGGHARCWGNNEDGQASPPPHLGEVISIAAGRSHTCALNVDGLVNCWGGNELGQTKIPLNLGAVQSVSAGDSHTCVVNADGHVSCWGNNAYGLSHPPADLGVVQSISAGVFHTCAVNGEGAVRCWGGNNFKQLEIPKDLGIVKSVSATGFRPCAVTIEGKVRCWGSNLWDKSVPPNDLDDVQSISTGIAHSCAVAGGVVRCWGEDTDWQPPSTIAFVYSVSSNSANSCAVNADRTVTCWGRNTFGQLTVPKGLIVKRNVAL